MGDETATNCRMGGLWESITDHKEAENHLKASSEQLRRLSASLQSARETEAARIARQIHDELGGIHNELPLGTGHAGKAGEQESSAVATAPCNASRLGEQQSTAVLRIVQDALTNVLRQTPWQPACASRSRKGRNVHLTVTDNRRGIKQSETLKQKLAGTSRNAGARQLDRCDFVGGAGRDRTAE
jgi:signal transduction histidine kinase